MPSRQPKHTKRCHPEPACRRQAGRGICFFLTSLLFATVLSAAPKEPSRPRILGIGIVSLAASPPKEAMSFYGQVGFRASRMDCASVCTNLIQINPHQQLSVFIGHPDAAVKEDLGESSPMQIFFETSDVEAMRGYLTGLGISCSGIIRAPHTQFSLDDPDGHHIGFIQFEERELLQRPHSQNQVSSRLIHAGFVVHDRAATDHFYKDILGFRPYWHGGMKDDRDDWVAMQVPDGTDWIEYMLNIPADASHKLLGIMNHIALGVPDIQAAKAQLIKNGWKPGEEPKLGRDGKWQLNLYDPDDTRIEFMEFAPKEKPCCSEFTGTHPKP